MVYTVNYKTPWGMLIFNDKILIDIKIYILELRKETHREVNDSTEVVALENDKIFHDNLSTFIEQRY